MHYGISTDEHDNDSFRLEGIRLAQILIAQQSCFGDPKFNSQTLSSDFSNEQAVSYTVASLIYSIGVKHKTCNS